MLIKLTIILNLITELRYKSNILKTLKERYNLNSYN